MIVADPLAIDTETRFVLRASRAPLLRSMEQFAAEEITLPSGPFQNQRFRLERQPFAGLWFREIDSGRWSRRVITGPSQSGKTLIGSAIPVCYHLFETADWVVYGVPDLDMVRDKWEGDLLPVIEQTRYRDLLPRAGGGSRGGMTKSIRFANGAVLRFMTFGGSDKSRAGFPGRVLVVTEVDGAVSSEASLEADKVKQLEARLRSHGSRKLVYLECTVTVEAGRIWSEYQAGTASRIACPCPHCGVRVTPEREHLLGWEEAESVMDARDSAFFACPACGEVLTDEDRRTMNMAGQLVHRGQEVTEDGQIVGPLPKTDAFGFRWNAFNNLFVTAADLAADEWNAKRARDKDNSEREMLQFVWCVPYQPPEVDLVPLDPEAVAKRHAGLKRGIVPPDCVGISIGVDTGKRALHWTAVAMTAGGSGRVIDYGVQTVEADTRGIRAGLIHALRDLHTYLANGWPGPGGQMQGPSQVWIDSGYHEHTDAVYDFCHEANAGLKPGSEIYRPSKGYGEGERLAGRYVAPKAVSTDVRFVGREFHLSRVKRANQLLVHMNADHWKSDLRQRLAMPTDEPGAVVLWEPADKHEHADWVDQVLAEEPHEKLDSNNRPVVVWIRVRRKNHFLDATYQALAAGEFVLTMLAKERAKPVGSWFGREKTR